MTSYYEQVIADGAVAMWRLSETEGGTAIDSIGSAMGVYMGTPELNQPSVIFTDPNGSARLGGDGDYININNVAPVMASSLDWTIEMWFKAPNQTSTTYGGVLFAVNSSSKGNWFMARFDHPDHPGGVWVEDSAQNTWMKSPMTNLDDDKPHHLIVKRSSSDQQIHMYVDGQYQGNLPDANDSCVIRATDLVSIGQEWDSGESDFFLGNVDEIAFYKQALAVDRIQLHNALGRGTLLDTAEEVDEAKGVHPIGFIDQAEEWDQAGQIHPPHPKSYREVVLEDSPIGYWRLNEKTGLVVDDLSGNNNDGEYVGAITKGGAGPNIGLGSGSAYFDGSSTTYPRLRWANPTFLPKVSAWTMEVWIKTVRATATEQVLWAYGGNNELSFFLKGNSLNLISRNTNNTINFTDGAVVNDGKWHHFVVTHDGSATARVYIDGQMRGTDTSVATIPDSGASAYMTFGQEQDSNDGNYSTAQAFYGSAGEGALYGYALSATRIAEHYKAGRVTSKELGQAEEVDEGQPLSNGIFWPLEQAEEVDEANFAHFILPIGKATDEVDEAFAIPSVNPPDQFVAPWVIWGESGKFTHDMTSSTLDAGEPNLFGATKTSWFQWTPPDGMTSARLHTRGSDAPASIAVYQGADLGSLVEIASASDGEVRLELPVPIDGTTIDQAPTYMIQVGVSQDPCRSISISWMNGEPEEYDSFTTPRILESDYGSDEFTVSNGTVEPGEPIPAGTVATSWLRWDSNTDQAVSFLVRGFDQTPYTVRVYYGTAFGDLTLATEVTGTDQQQVTIDPAVVGRTYYIQVSSGDDVSSGFEIAWFVQAVPIEPFPLPAPTAADPIPHVPLHAMLYEADNTFVTEIPRRMGVSLQEPLNIVGVGAMSVALTDPIMQVDNDLLRWGRVVKFFLGTKCIHAFMIKERNTSYVKSDEYTGFIVTVGGPSVHFMLDHFIVRHDGDPRPDSLSSRFYSWASKPGEWYNASDWDTVVHQNSMDDPPSKKKKKKPKNWKVRDAKWIWHPGPYKYFRKTINIKDDGTLVRIFATADEWYRVYLDGEQILDDRNVEVGYTKHKKIDTTLSKGKHTFAALVRGVKSANIGDGNDSFLFAMCKLDLDGKIIKPALLVSDSSWECHIGNPPPGWNRAQVLRNVVKEARQRGIEAAERLTFGFDGDVDSEGKPWPNVQFNQEVQIGTSALDLQSQLSEGNGFDVWVNPEDFTLEAWKRRGKDKSASVTLEPGRNLLDWEVREKDEALNKWLIQYDGGWTEYDAKGSQEDLEIRESFVSLGSVKDEKSARNLMKRVAQSIAKAQERAGTGDVRKRPDKQPDGGLIGVKGAYPFLDFETGDVVSGPNRKGRLVPIRVMSLSLTEDANGNLSFDPELEVV